MAVISNQQIHNQSLEIFKRGVLTQYDEDKQIDFIRLRYGGSSKMQSSSKKDASSSRLSSESAPSLIGDTSLREIASKLDRLQENICKKHQNARHVNRQERQKVVHEQQIDTQLIQAQQKISRVLASKSDQSESPFILQIKQKLSFIYKKSLLMRRDSINKKNQIKDTQNEVNALQSDIVELNDKILKAKAMESEQKVMKHRQIDQMKQISKRFQEI